MLKKFDFSGHRTKQKMTIPASVKNMVRIAARFPGKNSVRINLLWSV